MFYERAVIENFAIFTGKQLESHFNKVADVQACKFIEKGLQHRCFPVHITNFLRTSILKKFICFMSFLIKLQPNLSLNSYPQKHV